MASWCISHRHPHLHYTQHFSLYWPAAEEPPSSVSLSLCYVQTELAASLRLSASLSCESRPLNSLKCRSRPNKHRLIRSHQKEVAHFSSEGLLGGEVFRFILFFAPRQKQSVPLLCTVITLTNPPEEDGKEDKEGRKVQKERTLVRVKDRR